MAAKTVKKGKKEEVEIRAIKVAAYIIENKSTLRAAGKVFGISKSTAHRDCTKILARYDYKGLSEDVKKVLANNLKESAIRGGEATKKKYASKEKK